MTTGTETNSDRALGFLIARKLRLLAEAAEAKYPPRVPDKRYDGFGAYPALDDEATWYVMVFDEHGGRPFANGFESEADASWAAHVLTKALCADEMVPA